MYFSKVWTTLWQVKNSNNNNKTRSVTPFDRVSRIDSPELKKKGKKILPDRQYKMPLQSSLTAVFKKDIE